MMGHIQNLLVELIERLAGAEGVRETFALAGLEPRRYHPEVIYPEAEFQALYRATLERFELEDRAAQEAFAEYFIEVSPQRFPAIFEVAGDARSLLERVPVIHASWPSAASAEEFRQKVFLADAGVDRLLLHYDSPNRLCRVLTRSAELVLEHYGERGQVRELACVRDGAPHCEIEVRFEDSRGCA